MYTYHCTVYRCRFGILQLAGTHTIKNCISDSCFAGDYTGSFTATNCLSSDTTSPTAALRSKNPVYVNEGGTPRNLKLDATDTDCKDIGSDPSDANITVTDDIVGTARPQGSGWDLGFFEVVAGGGATENPALRRLGGILHTPRLSQPGVQVWGAILGAFIAANIHHTMKGRRHGQPR